MSERSRDLAAQRTAARIEVCKHAFHLHAHWKEFEGDHAAIAYGKLCEEIGDPELLDALLLLAKAEARRADREELTASGTCVFAGWEPTPEDPTTQRFVAKVQFNKPPALPLGVAWGAHCILTFPPGALDRVLKRRPMQIVREDGQ